MHRKEGLNVGVRVSEACVCFTLHEVCYLGDLGKDPLVRHFLDFEDVGGELFEAQGIVHVEQFSDNDRHIFKMSKQTEKFFFGDQLKSRKTKTALADLLEANQPRNQLLNEAVFDELSEAVFAGFEKFRFKNLRKNQVSPLKAHVLNVFIRGPKKSGKSTLSLGLANRLRQNASIIGIQK